MFGKRERREPEPAQRAEPARAAPSPSTTGLSGDTKIKDWLADPRGGPVLREFLAQGGRDESQLEPVRGFAMKRLISMSNGQFTEEVIAQLVVKAESYHPASAPKSEGGVSSSPPGESFASGRQAPVPEPGSDGEDSRFAGRTVVVTGAGSGVGRATASRVARRGGRVIAVDRQSARLEELANELRDFDVVTVVADITVHADGDAVTHLMPAASPGADDAILPSGGGRSAV